MLTTFTTKYGDLVVRSEDLRRLQDVQDGCVLAWVEEGQRLEEFVLGTAAENRDRIVAEEAKAIAAYEEMQQRRDRGLPPLPIVRGGRVR